LDSERQVLNELPLVIPTYNNHFYLINFIRQCENFELKNLIVVDNNSTDDDMKILLKDLEKKYNIIRLDYNYGPRYVLHSDRIRNKLPNKILLSDPDIRLNQKMPIDFVKFLSSLSEKYKIGKVGLALNIDSDKIDLNKKIAHENVIYTIQEWEEKYWEKRIANLDTGDPFYQAEIDTTFCLVNFDFFEINEELNGIRIAGNFTADHIPWLRESGLKLKNKNSYSNNKVSNWEDSNSNIDLLKMRNEIIKINLEKNLEKIRKENALDEVALLHKYLDMMHNSKSWKATAPLRQILEILRRGKNHDL
jgi:glycosyltransferase involved in cell wall biosynthesis